VCSSPGKHPRTVHGLNDATLDVDTLRAWWGLWPQANIGIACGPSNLTVADVDVKNDAQGKATLAWVLERNRESFEHAGLAATPTGGWHYYFDGATRLPHNAFGPGIDIQSHGRYVLAPPSRAFGRYDEDKKAIAGSQAAYTWLRWEESLPAIPLPQQERLTLADIAGSEQHFEGEARDRIPHGSHRDALLRYSWTLRRVLGFTVEAAMPMMIAFLDTLEGYNPADPFTERDVRQMLENLPAHVAQGPAHEVARNPLTEAVRHSAELAPARPLSWIVPYFFPDHELILLYGAGGTGKSTLASWFAGRVTRLGGNFGVVGIEEPFTRFGARAVAMGADPDRLIAPAESAISLKFREHLAWIEAFIVEQELRFLYFDSLRTHFDGAKGEDSATAARNNLSGIASLAQRTGCGILGTFHTNKEDQYSGSTEMLNVPRVVLEAKNPSENKLTVNVHKGNFKKPNFKLAFMRDEIPFYANGQAIMQTFHNDDGTSWQEQETLPIWRPIANETVNGGSLEELAGKEPIIREMLEDNPTLSARAINDVVKMNVKKCNEIVARIKREL
jgi:energy-coupling factor transporter ATP-binding protein EcfA2